jgi:hypothetical protein
MAQNETDAIEDAESADHYGDEPVVELFSNPAVVRIITALVDGGPQDFAPGDICEMAGIARRTWYDNRDLLEAYGFIEETRTAGNTSMYRARHGEEPVEGFVHLYDALGAYIGADGNGTDSQ